MEATATATAAPLLKERIGGRDEQAKGADHPKPFRTRSPRPEPKTYRTVAASDDDRTAG